MGSIQECVLLTEGTLKTGSNSQGQPATTSDNQRQSERPANAKGADADQVPPVARTRNQYAAEGNEQVDAEQRQRGRSPSGVLTAGGAGTEGEHLRFGRLGGVWRPAGVQQPSEQPPSEQLHPPAPWSLSSWV